MGEGGAMAWGREPRDSSARATAYPGGLWDGYAWELVRDADVPWTYGAPRCHHASSLWPTLRRAHGGRFYVQWYVTMPRVVRAYNEGGYATTGVCADCVLERVIESGVREGLRHAVPEPSDLRILDGGIR